MTPEMIPQIGAVIIATISATTDILWGKVYNRFLLYGVFLALVWFGFFSAWHILGHADSLGEFPELGRWGAPPAVSTVDDDARFGLSDMDTVSVLPTTPEQWAKAQALPDTKDASNPTEPSILVYFSRVMINTLIAFAVGFSLWWFGMWAAGDAKLFAVLALLIPLSSYAKSFWPFFPSYVLIFNTFLSLIAILVLELVIRFIRQAFRPSRVESEAWQNAWLWIKSHVKDMIFGFIGILFLFLVIKTLRMLVRDAIGAFSSVTSSTLIYFILFLIFQPLVKLMRKRFVLIPVVALTLAFIVWVTIFPTEHYNLVTVLQVSSIMLALVGFLIVYELYLNVFDFAPIPVWDLRPQMILAGKTRRILEEDQDLLIKKMGPVAADGLTAEQTETLRRWWIDRGKGNQIWVSRTIPFAPALLAGTILTVFFAGYVLGLGN